MNRRWLVPLIIIGVLLLLVVMPLVGAYNDLVTKEADVDTSFADLDAQYQRRADLIPNLSAAVKASLKQEQEIFEQITDARAAYSGAGTPEEKVQAQNGLESALSRLLVIIEDNSVQLGSNERVRDLMTQLEGTENRVAQARRDYNGVVRTYNVSVRRCPRNIIAGMFGFDPQPLFEAEPEDRDSPEVGDVLDDAFDSSPAPSG
jgi:LemA protein